MSTTSGALAPAKPTARSRATNHKDLLLGADGRGVIARRFRDVTRAIISDQGGVDRMSEARLQLARRFAAV
jgi:hypothetical protein